MELTNRTRYALTTMLDLARAAQPVSLSELAQRQTISRGYLDKLLLRLSARGLVMRSAGPEYSFWLALLPTEIALADIVSAVHDRSNKRRRRGMVCSRRGDHRLGHYLWEALNQRILDFLAGISLADLMTREHVFNNLQRRVHKPRLRAVSSPVSSE